MRGHISAVAAIVFSLAVLPGPASAANTRFASQAGGGTAPCTSQSPACDLQTALNSADPGDTVSVASGSYSFASTVSASDANLDIVGAPGGSKPVLRFTGAFPSTGFAFAVGVTGGKLRNLAIEAPNGASAIGTDFTSFPAITLSGVDVTASGACAQLFGSTTLEDSTFHQTAGLPSAFPCLSVVGLGTGSSTIRNVEVTSSAVSLTPSAPTASLSGLGLTIDRLVATSTTHTGLGVAVTGNGIPGSGTATMRRSRVSGFASGLNVGPGAVVSDTVVAATAAIPPATAVQSTSGAMRNVTAVANGIGGRGLEILASTFPAPQNSTSVKNSVFRGDTADVVIDAGEGGHFSPPGCTP